jgi:NADP-dependent 3-hydroxy acid dehydrogenase YdfG
MNIPINVNLRDKVAVVTGGGGVLCSVFARGLSQCGARVALLGRTLSKLENTAELIRADGGEAAAFVADVTDKDSLICAHEAVLKRFGLCGILIIRGRRQQSGGHHGGRIICAARG